jgi:SAM-dependent methyltransferase
MQADGAASFAATGEAYDLFMGRYSKPLAVDFVRFAGVEPSDRVLDVGCGPGALTSELVRLVGADAVAACDPSPPFVDACRARNPGVEVRSGSAEHVPFDDSAFDAVLAQLVLHFVSDPAKAAVELARVTRPGGAVAACVWTSEPSMQLLRLFWDAALLSNPDAPDDAEDLRFGRAGELSAWLSGAGCVRITETTLTVQSTYGDFAELWTGYAAGVGPPGSYLKRRAPADQRLVRDALFESLGRPEGAFTLSAVARAARGRVPAKK